MAKIEFSQAVNIARDFLIKQGGAFGIFLELQEVSKEGEMWKVVFDQSLPWVRTFEVKVDRSGKVIGFSRSP